jgi:glycosyltransferase involved in cell wall biosynthesis
MTFSVVTPSYQQSEWLKLCVASVADQSVDHEHIVQDAGSSDGTLDWLPGDARVRCHVEKDRGMYDAVNRGLRRSQGECLAYLNCDEQYLPGALEAVGDFFRDHPDVEVVFADAVVVDPAGEYLFHRKSLVPLAAHTACFPLSTLTCATFFRRRVFADRGLDFDPAWRYCGDSVWVSRLIREGVPMAVLRRFTSAFTHTGGNLSLDGAGREEARKYYALAPASLRLFRPLILLHHRLRRWRGGIYGQAPFDFEIYTRAGGARRVRRRVDRPTARWRW